MAGYSQTPLARKLGIKEGFRIRLINQPDNYYELLKDLPPDVNMLQDKKQKKDLIHFFSYEAAELHRELKHLKKEIEQDGMIWVSWPKKSSRVETDITEDVIRILAIQNGLLDVKVCAIDETWSGLKLVIPVKYRK